MSIAISGAGEQLEDLFQEMVEWVEKQGSDYLRIHHELGPNGELSNVWCERDDGTIKILPEKYWDVATHN